MSDSPSITVNTSSALSKKLYRSAWNIPCQFLTKLNDACLCNILIHVFSFDYCVPGDGGSNSSRGENVLSIWFLDFRITKDKIHQK